jgi:transcriptional regulator with XRE-family HTH domain
MHEISQRIKYYRKKNGLTQMDVAAKLGIRTDNYAKYESGARTPRADRLVKLAKILGVSYDALNEGVERRFAALLSSHAIGATVSESCSFTAYPFDMAASNETYPVVAGFMDKGLHCFLGENPEFCGKYLGDPILADLIALYEMYRDQCEPNPPEPSITITYKVIPAVVTLEPATAYKWAFCIAVKRYLERNDAIGITDEVEKIAGNVLEHMNALQFFAVKVFVPYLSFIIDAVELCINTTIDDFEKAFLFYALTHPDDESELLTLLDGAEDDDDDDD